MFLVPRAEGVPWELGAVSNAEWTGVPLAAVLDRAGLKTDAVDVVCEGADTGDIVVALIDEEEATLKRFRRRGASIALEPANTAYEVRILPPNRVRIQGKLVGLFRRY